MRYCPECGAEAADAAAVCPRCGFPLRPDALRAPGAPPAAQKKNPLVYVAIGCALVLPVVFFGGIVAALVIPQFAQASRRAKEMEGREMLKQAYTLENQYQAGNGRYAATLAELRSEGAIQDAGKYYYLRLTRVADDALCIDAVPRPGADVSPLSIDTGGTILHTAGCAYDTPSSADTASFDTAAVPGATRT